MMRPVNEQSDFNAGSVATANGAGTRCYPARVAGGDSQPILLQQQALSCVTAIHCRKYFGRQIGSLLKERTLGIEVFDRPSTYDTNSEAVVRFTAGEVRKRLLLYYHERGRNSGVRISLPVGSYVPEFLHGHEEPADIEDYASSPEAHLRVANVSADTDPETHEARRIPLASGSRSSHSALQEEAIPGLLPGRNRTLIRGLWGLALGGMVALAFLAGLGWRSRTAYTQTPVDDFWMPVLREQRAVLICAGGVVFKQNNFSGVITAGKDIDYPFVSMQIASVRTGSEWNGSRCSICN